YFFFISANFFATLCPLLLHSGQEVAFEWPNLSFSQTIICPLHFGHVIAFPSLTVCAICNSFFF
ncbi:TPA: hypothetical protein ACWMKJ_003195, partial [Enterococcus faecalis]